MQLYQEVIILKRSTKYLCVILSFILLFAPLSTVFAGAVEYPAGVTKEQTEAVIPKLNSLVKALFKMSPETADIKGTVYETLYSDDTLNGLFSGIYTALGENASSLSIIGVDISPAALSEALDAYPSVSGKIASCGDLNEIIAASKNFKWDVSSKTQFGKAVAAMLSPFNSLLNALLCSGKVEINAFLAIQGDDGYQNAIVPLLQVLDCPSVMSSSEFKASAEKNHNNIIRNILSMVFDALDRLLDDPITGMCETLPKVAYYLDSGKLSASITSLLEPLSLKIAGVFTIAGISDLIAGAADLEGSLNINDMLEGMDLGDLLGADVNLKIPEIDLSILASCVTDNGGTLTTDKGASFIEIMNFVLDTLKLNKTELGALMGGNADMLSMLDPLLSKENGEIIKTVITLFSMESIPQNNYQWNYPSITSTAVTYTPTLTSMDYAGYLTKIDPLLTDFVKESDPEGTIEETLRKTIYSNSLVSTLVVGIFSMLGAEETAPLFALLGMDVTPTGIGNEIYEYYPFTARQLYKYSSWDKVNPDLLTWGFYDGDSQGFTRAVTRVLSPFIPLLSCILAGQNITFFDAVTIPGADGYNTAIIPLLEALGCKAENIKTYEEYKASANSSAVLTDILKPITALLDEICKSPVQNAVKILPNIVYFFNSGLMDSVLTNLLYPVKYMLDTAGMGELLDSAFKNEEMKLDINSLLSSLTEGSDMGIKLPELDLAVLGTLGIPTAYTSKRVANGQYQQYTYITADEPGVFLTILRYFVGALSMEENSGLLTGLMGSESSAPSEDGMPDMFAMYTGNITEKFKGMTTDEIIEWLCDLLFSESPVVEIPQEEEEIPTIIYEKKFELPSWAKLLIAAVIIALVALIYYILSVSGKLDNIKLKRKKKQEIKRRKKENKQLVKGGGTALNDVDIPIKTSKKKSSAKATASEGIPVNGAKKKEDTPLSPKAQARLLRHAKANEAKDTRLASKRLPDAKEAEKLARRQQQAQKRARKNEIRIQRQYEKAKRQAAKKNSK